MTALSAVHEYRLLVLESHLDTFGHVNNATYLQLFEQARWDWITRGGYGLDRVVATQQGPTILECTIKFRREVGNRQPIVIRTWVATYTGKIGRVDQELYRELPDGEELCCQASFVMALFDLEARKLIRPTPEWLRCLGFTPDAELADS